jgi:hypothetical protein
LVLFGYDDGKDPNRDPLADQVNSDNDSHMHVYCANHLSTLYAHLFCIDLWWYRMELSSCVVAQWECPGLSD